MKTNLRFLLLFFLGFAPIVSSAQTEKPKFQYSIGGGVSVDRSNKLWGLNMTNEVNYRLGKRTSLNAGISFYQSLGNLENKEVFPGQKSMDQSSGIFITPMLKYDILQRDSGFKLAFAAGPSLQLGGQSILFDYDYTDPENPDSFILHNKYQRIGLMMELEAEWKTKNPNIRNAASISAYGADNDFPLFINVNYKLRFNFGKK
ncbi:hypothetical protein C943_03668 [Mariniradius saccharolyticus AK6]|uniref:Outer membrane protein beta-barrel domain-containing protein n=1 Tax=Mariniradius saccharolyticus AK6 TaxID=1239962 RepID=M7XI01_9BACT|nr:outer membrane beta-barrel protein [Mariniradius saccharolyticus]EMS34449.1 hypothetical protein C943_03668 [Mariniradius saccharolyticus AK6]